MSNGSGAEKMRCRGKMERGRGLLSLRGRRGGSCSEVLAELRRRKEQRLTRLE